MTYQSFDDKPGSSASSEKWNALRINKFQDLEVLDLGCNEGFFIYKSLEAGAKRAVGVDRDPVCIDKAKKRIPLGEFYNQDWSDFIKMQKPASFDVVIVLSAMHYATNIADFLKDIRRVLRPGGLFILEASISAGVKAFMSGVTRGVSPHADTVFHPTGAKISKLLLEDFSIRYVGKSVMQPGDPISRHIYHAFPRMPVAMLISGKSGVGKSDLSYLLERSAPTYSMDLYILHMLENDKTDLNKILNKSYKPGRIDYVYDEIVKSGKSKEFVNSLSKSFQYESIFIIEGAGLLKEEINIELINLLNEKQIRIVNVNLDGKTYSEIAQKYK